MGDKDSHKKGEEKGNWCQIKSVKEVIANKEMRGESAKFERELLRSWSRYKGYEEAKQSLIELGNDGKS